MCSKLIHEEHLFLLLTNWLKASVTPIFKKVFTYELPTNLFSIECGEGDVKDIMRSHHPIFIRTRNYSQGTASIHTLHFNNMKYVDACTRAWDAWMCYIWIVCHIWRSPRLCPWSGTLYTSDLSRLIFSSCSLFADDTKIYNFPLSHSLILQHDLDTIFA